MKHIKVSLLILLVSVLFTNSVFSSEVKIYTIDAVVLNDDVIW